MFIDSMMNSTEVVVHALRGGGPPSVVVPETINAARQLILQDRHVTYRQIAATLGISGTNIHSILHEHLIVKKICSRWIVIGDESWIYTYDPESKQQSTVWVFQKSQVQQKLLAHEALFRK